MYSLHYIAFFISVFIIFFVRFREDGNWILEGMGTSVRAQMQTMVDVSNPDEGWFFEKKSLLPLFLSISCHLFSFSLSFVVGLSFLNPQPSLLFFLASNPSNTLHLYPHPIMSSLLSLSISSHFICDMFQPPNQTQSTSNKIYLPLQNIIMTTSPMWQDEGPREILVEIILTPCHWWPTVPYLWEWFWG